MLDATSPLTALARRKWIVIATFLVVVLTAAGVSQMLDKVYTTSTTLLVALRSDNNQSFDTVQASQAIARSYADIIDSPNIADGVVRRLGGRTTKKEIEGATTFEPLPETQLLRINADAASPERAKKIADAYAAVFIDYARANLADATQATIILADSAPLARSPSRPKPKLYVLVAAILGLVLGLALALLRDRLDRRLRSAEEVEAHFNVPVLARVPRRGRSERDVSAFTEANRILRTNLQFAKADGPLRSIAITSAGEGEGKTTIAANLAVTSAETGLEVIAVEADLRRPTLQNELLREPREPLRPGFSNYLVDGSTLDECLAEIGRPGVRLMPAGPLPPSPSALLESRLARGAVAALVEKGDLVIFDCPPLTVGADASIIAERVDGVVLVVDLQASTINSVRQALGRLKAVKAPLLGLLINSDRTAASSSYSLDKQMPAATLTGAERKREKV